MGAISGAATPLRGPFCKDFIIQASKQEVTKFFPFVKTVGKMNVRLFTFVCIYIFISVLQVFMVLFNNDFTESLKNHFITLKYSRCYTHDLRLLKSITCQHVLKPISPEG